MTIRRTSAPRKRPGPAPELRSGQAQAVGRDVSDRNSDDEADALRDGIDQVAREFEESLRSDASLSDTQRTAMARQFEAALEEQLVSAAGAPVVPDRDAWTATIDDLRRNGVLSENDATELVRQLGIAFTQFEKRETKLAIEFSRRLQVDGEESALAWYREQQAEEPRTNSLRKPEGGAPEKLRTDVVNSRSRRLRGPPKS